MQDRAHAAHMSTCLGVQRVFKVGDGYKWFKGQYRSEERGRVAHVAFFCLTTASSCHAASAGLLLAMWTRLASIYRSSCHCLPSTRIKSVHHHILLLFLILIFGIFSNFKKKKKILNSVFK